MHGHELLDHMPISFWIEFTVCMICIAFFTYWTDPARKSARIISRDRIEAKNRLGIK